MLNNNQKKFVLDTAITITKEYASSGAARSPDDVVSVLNDVHKKLTEIVENDSTAD